MKTLGTIIRFVGCIWLAWGLVVLAASLFVGSEKPASLILAAANIAIAFGAFYLGNWIRNRSPNVKPLVDEEPLWQSALEEFESVDRRPGLWAQSFARAHGNEGAAKAIYLKKRVQELQQQAATVLRGEKLAAKVAGESSSDAVPISAVKTLAKSYSNRHT